MSTISSELMAGFLTEARGYVVSLRQCLDQEPSPEMMQQIFQYFSILSGAAEMLEMGEMAELIGPAEVMLRQNIEKGKKLSRKDADRLKTTIDKLDQYIQSVSGWDEQPAAAPAAASSFQPMADLPPDLLEVFGLEANEHSQIIQANLELLGRSPGDHTLISELRRVTHTLKGASASVGFDVIARVAHLMEDLLDRQLNTGGSMVPEAVSLLFDSADALDGLISKGLDESLAYTLKAIDERYSMLLGDAYMPPPTAAAEPALQAETPKPAQTTRSSSLLRLPLATVDLLINRVGEVVINRSVLERHLGTMRALLSDLDYSTKRLGRVADDITTQIDLSPMFGLSLQEAQDQAFDPLELERYSLLYQHARELEEIAADTGDVNDKLSFLAEDLDASLTRERRLTTELQNGLMNTRLVPFLELETRLRQVVRRTAHNLNKQVELDLVGFETQVDKSVLEALADPIMHLLRNAVDHGVETADERLAARKTEVALIALRVSRERGRVVLSVSDDGAGIDLNAVRQRAISLGVFTETDHPTSDQLLNLLFEEGFSLTDTVTQTSGRGVGLNVVRHALSQLQGSVRIETALGMGTTFVISVPVTLAITRALFIRSRDQEFAVPLEQIAAVIRLPTGALKEITAEGVLHHEGKALATYQLGDYVGGPGAEASPRYGLLVEADGQETIILLDRLTGIHEAVVKSLGPHLRHVHGISGATIAGDGRVILILDLAELVGGERRVSQPAEAFRLPIRAPIDTSLHVLVVDDSPSVRRVVTAFLEHSGWQATSAKDGIDALEKMASLRPDVALVDIEMPRMNGYELLAQMKTDPMLQGIPVVFLTSRSATKHRKRAEQLMVDGYLIKPYREEEMLAELLRVTRNSK